MAVSSVLAEQLMNTWESQTLFTRWWFELNPAERDTYQARKQKLVNEGYSHLAAQYMAWAEWKDSHQHG